MSQPTDLRGASRAFLDDSREAVANLLHFLQEAGRDLDAGRVQWVIDQAEAWARGNDEPGGSE